MSFGPEYVPQDYELIPYRFAPDMRRGALAKVAKFRE